MRELGRDRAEFLRKVTGRKPLDAKESARCPAAEPPASGRPVGCTRAGAGILRPSTPAILIAPTNTVLDPAHPVHRNVTISGNVFDGAGAPVVHARAVRGPTFTGNHLTGADAEALVETDLVAVEGCSDVVVEGTSGAPGP
ncbi:hypothetical protein ACFC09_16755 [Streptomyces sp. NPDC056161]|uniref:hypothetical protein n=1 Tax=Streptomyces sp. NPDC056161 TaxID=3345732 RepID=UPI0035DB4895